MSAPTLEVPPAAASTRTDHLFRATGVAGATPALRGLLAEHRTAWPAVADQAVPPPAAPCGSVRLHPVDREALRKSLRELPALPQAAMQALAALRDERASTEHCASLIGRDQALAARTLRLANSAFYGVPGRVASVRDAVNLLGRSTLSSLLTLATVAAQFDGASCPGFSFGGFWRHSMAVAMASRGLARALGRDDEPAFTVGLLHDIGRLALAVHFPAAMAAALAQAGDAPHHAVEHDVMGVDHLDVGAQVAAQWNFPAEVLVAIAAHHAPKAAMGAAASLADVVHVADALAHALDLAGDPHERVPELDAAAWRRLALAPRALLAVMHETEAGVAELSHTMGL